MNIGNNHRADCVFCRELAGSRQTNFADRYPELSSRIIGETQALVAFPCIGQISEGHFLIIPKSHVATMRDAAAAVIEFGRQLAEITAHVHSLLDVSPKDSLYFEHGAEFPGDGGCGIYHAHLHVVPNAGRVDLAQHFPQQSRKFHADVLSALSELNSVGSYFMFGSHNQGFVGQGLAEPLPSQTLRRLAAKELNSDSWDWREAGREAKVFDLVRKAVIA